MRIQTIPIWKMVFLGVILILFVPSAAALESSKPYSTKQFLAESSVNPLFATKKAIETGNDELLHQLDFSRISAHDAEQILDMALNPSFPASKIGEAIAYGAILKTDTWKKLTETQLSSPLSNGGVIRDTVPDLTILNAAARDESIKIDAGIPIDDSLITNPRPGATTTTVKGTVTLSDLDSISFSTRTVRIIGTGLARASVARNSISAAHLERLEFTPPSKNPLPRSSINPTIGSSGSEDRWLELYNASNVSIDSTGKITIGAAQIIRVFIPSNPSRQSRTGSTIGATKPHSLTDINPPGVNPKDLSITNVTLSDSHQTTIQIEGIFTPNETTNKTHLPVKVPSFSTVKAARAEIFGLSVKGMEDMESSIQRSSMRFRRAVELDFGSLSFRDPREASISTADGYTIRLAPATTTPIQVLGQTIKYETLSTGNLLSLKWPLPALPPLQTLRSSPPAGPTTRFTINSARLSFTRLGTVETIDAGNETTVSVSRDGIACASTKPLSTYTYNPGTRDQSFSLVTFAAPHTICITREEGMQLPHPCTEHCTLIDLPNKRIISDGIVDYQRYPTSPAGLSDKQNDHMASLITPYYGATLLMQYDSKMKNILNTTAIAGEFIVYKPNNYLTIIDQGGHRIIRQKPTEASSGIADTIFHSIEGHSGLPFQTTSTYAVQHTPTGRGIYILYPGNPQINQLITQANARILRYTP